MIIRVSFAACAIALTAWGANRAPLPPLACDTFAAARSIAAMQSAIGSKDATLDTVPLGASEGDMVPATVFFPDVPNRRIEVVWRDGNPAKGPRYVRLRRRTTEWRTKEGVSIGTSLQRLEQLNGRSFHLAGFGFDYAATVTSWDGGRLHASFDAPCQVIVRVDSLPSLNAQQRDLYRQVVGDRIFSSAHPAMQAMDPRVGELLLEFP